MQCTEDTSGISETDLYPPIRDLLRDQGYDVKAEIEAADVVACRDGEPPIIVELKTAFSLGLIHQAIARQAITDAVYVAVPHRPGKRFARAMKANAALCRRLGLGLIVVRLSDGLTQIHLDPAPYRPRKSKARKGRLLREFARRQGDPNTGGATRRSGLVTAYRQDATRIADHLAQNGASRGSEVAAATGVPRATRMMADDVYGWFERRSRGIYALTPAGRDMLAQRGT